GAEPGGRDGPAVPDSDRQLDALGAAGRGAAALPPDQRTGGRSRRAGAAPWAAGLGAAGAARAPGAGVHRALGAAAAVPGAAASRAARDIRPAGDGRDVPPGASAGAAGGERRGARRGGDRRAPAQGRRAGVHGLPVDHRTPDVGRGPARAPRAGGCRAGRAGRARVDVGRRRRRGGVLRAPPPPAADVRPARRRGQPRAPHRAVHRRAPAAARHARGVGRCAGGAGGAGAGARAERAAPAPARVPALRVEPHDALGRVAHVARRGRARRDGANRLGRVRRARPREPRGELLLLDVQPREGAGRGHRGAGGGARGAGAAGPAADARADAAAPRARGGGRSDEVAVGVARPVHLGGGDHARALRPRPRAAVGAGGPDGGRGGGRGAPGSSRGGAAQDGRLRALPADDAHAV
ncbi:MAG: hypothetical protein AVDCRST_MAG11-3155, partial [uncultured Gemmatimonadaceae bacterium]